MTVEKIIQREQAKALNTDMVQRLERELKTQTRAPMRLQPPSFKDVKRIELNVQALPPPEEGKRLRSWDAEDYYGHVIGSVNPAMLKYNPFGAPGDTLWVRESATVLGCIENKGQQYVLLEYEANGKMSNWIGLPDRLKWFPTAGHKCPNGIFREAARLFLTVKRVWAERIQDISEQDAQAEGCYQGERYYAGSIHPVKGCYKCFPTGRMAFRDIWDSIYAKRGLGFDANPWVFACEFEKREPEA